MPMRRPTATTRRLRDGDAEWVPHLTLTLSAPKGGEGIGFTHPNKRRRNLTLTLSAPEGGERACESHIRTSAGVNSLSAPGGGEGRGEWGLDANATTDRHAAPPSAPRRHRRARVQSNWPPTSPDLSATKGGRGHWLQHPNKRRRKPLSATGGGEGRGEVGG